VHKLNLKPVYGWGWFLTEGPSIDVPSEFVLCTIEEDESTISGTIEAPHQYENKTVVLTVRSEHEGITHYNVLVYDSSNQVELTGFAELIN